MLIFICASCSSYKGIAYIDENMKKVRLGMTQKKVISILGDNHEVVAYKGEACTLGYKSSDSGIYKLVFMDDKLQKWNKEWLILHHKPERRVKF